MGPGGGAAVAPRPRAAHDQPVLRPRHRDVEGADEFGFGRLRAVLREGVPSRRSGPEDRVLERAADLFDASLALRVGAASMMGLEQVHVPEVEPLGLMDREDAHRILTSGTGSGLLALALLGHRRPERPQDALDVGARLIHRPEEATEEALQVRDAEPAERPGGLRGLEERRGAEALEELHRRVPLERLPQGAEVARERDQVVLPAAHAFEARDPGRRRRGDLPCRGVEDGVDERRGVDDLSPPVV